MNKSSFTSADAIPIKLLYHNKLKHFSPIHIQWIPTNHCNLKCICCSCKNRDKKKEMDFAVTSNVIEEFAKCGVKAVTLTGGGEPLMYPDIEDTIDTFIGCGINVGLVTNGLLLHKIHKSTLEKLMWCRISSMDERDLTNIYRKKLKGVVQSTTIDWAFSHVVSANPNLFAIKRLIEFANQQEFTHVRLVSDLLNTSQVDTTFSLIHKHLKGIDQKVIYQPRDKPKKCKSCLIGYIKPLIGPDFKMYHCCGVQYALKEKSLDLPDSLMMGVATDLNSIYQTAKPFSVNCTACYYTCYNDILGAIQKGISHKDFV